MPVETSRWVSAWKVHRSLPLMTSPSRPVTSKMFTTRRWLVRESKRPGTQPSCAAKGGLPADVPVAGIVARLVPVKGHELFLDAAAELQRRRPEVHVCADWRWRAPRRARGLCRQGRRQGHLCRLGNRPQVRLRRAGRRLPDVLQRRLSGGHGLNGLLVKERDAVVFSRCVEQLLEQPGSSTALDVIAVLSVGHTSGEVRPDGWAARARSITWIKVRPSTPANASCPADSGGPPHPASDM